MFLQASASSWGLVSQALPNPPPLGLMNPAPTTAADPRTWARWPIPVSTICIMTFPVSGLGQLCLPWDTYGISPCWFSSPNNIQEELCSAACVGKSEVAGLYAASFGPEARQMPSTGLRSQLACSHLLKPVPSSGHIVFAFMLHLQPHGEFQQWAWLPDTSFPQVTEKQLSSKSQSRKE